MSLPPCWYSERNDRSGFRELGDSFSRGRSMSRCLVSQVDQLFRAQLFHDRKQYEERRRMSPADRAKTPCVDYLRLGSEAVGSASP